MSMSERNRDKNEKFYDESSNLVRVNNGENWGNQVMMNGTEWRRDATCRQLTATLRFPNNLTSLSIVDAKTRHRYLLCKMPSEYDFSLKYP